jgi:hypothetical protein
MAGDDPGCAHAGRYTIDCPDAGPTDGCKCPDCNGSGAIRLLITTRPCTACGGTGAIARSIASFAFDPSANPKEPLDACDWSIVTSDDALAGYPPMQIQFPPGERPPIADADGDRRTSDGG